MENHFERLANHSALEDWIGRSYREPVVIFKHSDTCGISSRAYAEMIRLDRPVALVTVQMERKVSNEIEARFKVAHESPQALVLRNGEIVWSASHGQISTDALAAAMEAAGAKQ